MKKNILSKVLPIGIGLMALTFAFANENKSSETDAFLMDGYIYNTLEEICEKVQVDCSETGNVACTFNGHDVYKNISSSETSCSVPLLRWE